MKSLLAPLALILCTNLAAAAPDRDDVRVTWNDKRYTTDELPTELGDDPRATIELWRPWAAEHGYEMSFAADSRVLLLHSRKSNPRKALALIEETAAHVNEAAPLDAPRPAITRAPEAPPETPGGEPVALDPGTEPPATTWTWEDTGPERGTQTAVVIECVGDRDYRDALELIAEKHDYLRAWLPSAQRMSGFTLERPLCAAFLRNGPGSEEWDPENELVHRTTRLLFLREFGRQPYWLETGLAWYVEQEIRGTLYCFPHRDGFVGVTEHNGWDRALKNAYKKRDAVEMDEVARFERGTWDPQLAHRALGAATFLAKHHPEDLTAILEELFDTIRRDGRENHADGTWELIPDWEPPADAQDAIVAARLGPDWRDELLESFQKGRSYKP